MSTTPHTPPLLDVTDLRVHYTRRGVNVRAVDGVTFGVASAETLGLVGESGCGKSTIAKAVVRLIRATGGRIEFGGHNLGSAEGKELAALRPRLQMVFQDPYSSLNPRMSVRASIEEPLIIHGRGDSRARGERVHDLMGRVGLARSVERRYPFQLSGGQRQRVGIARALSLDPDLIVADEPTSALDVSIQAQILTLLEEIQRDLGLTYLFISHDLGAIRQLAARIAVMYLGRICEIGPAGSVLDNPAHPYTVALLSAAPVPDPIVEARRERIVLRGDVPNPANPPSGCRFHTRCWLRTELGSPEVCAHDDPPPTARAGGGLVNCHFAEHVTNRRPMSGDRPEASAAQHVQGGPA
ncbi:MAG: peptide/nickel transport system ATP-binding protein [Gaiellales bacterium]|jgi:oligopeptide/dipeptide ABC transporter ATP-binding protein|nr:peptide/nickel transport system ATP-binding protein [Gaiellales bacterium]